MQLFRYDHYLEMAVTITVNNSADFKSMSMMCLGTDSGHADDFFKHSIPKPISFK